MEDAYPFVDKLYLASTLARVDNKYAYLVVNIAEEQKLERRRYPFLNEGTIGNHYEIMVRLPAEEDLMSGPLEILSIEESLFTNSRHMKCVAPAEIWEALLSISEMPAA